MVLAILDPLEYVTLYFIFMFIPPRICEVAHTFSAVGLGGRTCEVPARWKHDCQHIGPRGSVSREREATRK